MRHISEVLYELPPERRQQRDPFARRVFANLPTPLRDQMLRKHSGSEQHVLECWECWLVAKEVWERKRHLAYMGHITEDKP